MIIIITLFFIVILGRVITMYSERIEFPY